VTVAGIVWTHANCSPLLVLGLTNLAKYAGDPELKRRLAEQHAKTVTNIPSASIQKLEQKK